MLPPWAIDLVKVLGTSAVLVIMWFISHRSSERRFDKFMEQLEAERNAHMEQIAKERAAAADERKTVANEFMEIRKQAHENNRLTIDLLRVQTQILSRLEPVVEQNREDLQRQTTHMALINQQLQVIERKIN